MSHVSLSPDAPPYAWLTLPFVILTFWFYTYPGEHLPGYVDSLHNSDFLGICCARLQILVLYLWQYSKELTHLIRNQSC